MKTVSFIIPVVNEEKRLDTTFEALKRVKMPRGLKLTQIVFVSDGSTDKTVSRIKNFVSSQILETKYQIHLVSYKQNRGKGYAVREGLKRVTADYALLLDSDMSTPLSELEKFAHAMKNGVAVIVGTRKNGKSTVINHQPIFRELLGKGFTKLTRLILGLKGTDFTCGFKALSRPAQEVYKTQGVINRWGYDAELIFLSQKFNQETREVPVVWSNDPGTKVRLGRDVLTTLSELLLIRLTDLKGGYIPRVSTRPVISV